jgi:hypothetical protein
MQERQSTHLVDPQVRIWRDDRSSRKVDSLSTEVSSEPTLLSLESLAEPSDRLVVGHWRDAGHLGIDVHGDRELEKVPVFLRESKTGIADQL